MRGDFTRLTFDRTKHYRGVLMQQGRVQLDADWNENLAIAGRVLRTTTIDVIGGCGVPLGVDAFRIGAAPAAPPATADFTISGGRIYIDGLLCELEADTTYRTQPDYLDPAALGLDTLAAGQSRRDLVYVDAWYRAISAIEDPHIREKALGGPDTAERLKLLAQVMVLPGIGADATCKSPFPVTATGGGTLQVLLTPTPQPPDPCEPLAEGGYQGPDNRLYRVEIHQGGPLGTATFKWSRDNGSVAQAVERFDSTTRLTVASLGRDDYLKFRTGDFVEVSDDATDLSAIPGTLTQITVNEASRELTLATAVPASVSGATGRHPKVRRWDGGDAQPTAAAPIDIEDGVKVQFAATGEDFRAADYWIFAARVVDGSLDPLLDAPAAPMGVRHAYCPVAIITWRRSGNNVVVDSIEDCRVRFPPLTQLPTGTGEGCECATCVTAESHNSGTLTIQAAIDQVLQRAGGNICLGPGDYELQEPVKVSGRNIHLRGQGTLTRLHFGAARSPADAAVELRNACDCSLERVAVLYGPAGSAVQIVNCVDTTVRGCALLSRANPDQRGAAGPAIQLVENVLNTKILDNLVIAEIGVGPHTRVREGTTAFVAAGTPLLLAETVIGGNRFACARAGVELINAPIFVVRALSITENQFDQCSLAGVAVEATVGPAAFVEVTGNIFEAQGFGVALDCGRARVKGNLFTSLSRQAGINPTQAAILLYNLSDLDLNREVAIAGNRFEDVRGHGVLIRGRARDLVISHNLFARLGGGGIITDKGGSVEALTVEGNDLSDIALDEVQFPQGVAGAIVLGVTAGGRLVDNTIARVGIDLFKVRVAGIALMGSTGVLVSGNSLSDIGGPQNGLENAGIEASGLVAELNVAQNSVRRASQPAQPPLASPWYALRIVGAETLLTSPAGATVGTTRDFFTLANTAFALVRGRATQTATEPQSLEAAAAPNRMLAITALAAERVDAFASTGLAVSAFVPARASAAVADNYFESSGATPVVDVGGLSELVLSGNRCFLTSNETYAAVRLASSRSLVLASNTVDGSGYIVSVEVVAAPPGLTAVGNVVHQPMNGVPAIWQPLNANIP